ncbi:MAG: hypothetical protein WA610_00905 [Thermodesulfovibrionales bacterium]
MATTRKPAAKKPATKKAAKKVSGGLTKKALMPAGCCPGGQGSAKR